MKLEELFDKVFFPSNIVIIGFILFILYSIQSPLVINNVIIFIISIAVYGVAILLIKKRIRDENKSYSIASLIAFASFIGLLSVITVSKELVYGAVSLFPIIPLHYFIRPRWKISTHTCGCTGVATTLSIIDTVFVPMFLLIPLVAWSRIKLKRHDLLQVLVGMIIGFILPVIVFYIMYLVKLP